MKITIEGEPKEIAAYELALKDGKVKLSESKKIQQTKETQDKIRAFSRACDAIRNQTIAELGHQTAQQDNQGTP